MRQTLRVTLPEFDPQLKTVLERARTAGFFGPGPLRVHLASCRGFDEAVKDARAAASGGELPARPGRTRVVDLGAGGGLPGLPVAVWNSTLEVVLLDTSAKRTAFLQWAVAELGIGDRVTVVEGRAEEFAHSPERGRFDLAIARGFASPGITMECAAPLLAPDGRLLVAGPPGGRRWNDAELAALGLEALASVHGREGHGREGEDRGSDGSGDDAEVSNGEPASEGSTVAVVEVLRRIGQLDDRIPRPWRQLSKRPRPVEQSGESSAGT